MKLLARHKWTRLVYTHCSQASKCTSSTADRRSRPTPSDLDVDSENRRGGGDKLESPGARIPDGTKWDGTQSEDGEHGGGEKGTSHTCSTNFSLLSKESGLH